MTDSLVAFLRARLDEEQREAEAALERTTTTRRRIGGQWVEGTIQPPEWRRSVWPPARVLAEVDAKRRIIEQHTVTEASEFEGKTDTITYCPICRNDGECPTLRLLALPYADHPDYRAEWRP